ncbi:YHS domain-containing (seleno)protein [Roseovarius atlanticus]|uniref:YHS domain-containing (seleno)protein n=2 Tax=Roseovarius atlanticus TaxID=1641875 RepID=UPI001C973F01|nr:YHS domain-containing (seleno)protein [Roseovarius atlanticus]MBY5990076.1 YHS domain protein [Roseovarius atlanticus]MBY6126622.1 YHS domain protein [Roseovarius atlanticus]MBY6151116.1 YHS domain protein [Roseovarius atlanticus]
MHLTRRGMIASGAAVLLARPVMADEPRWYQNRAYAANGADVVAYFGLEPGADGVAGSDEFVTEWNGAKWRFSTAANQAAFEADPQKYAPQFGGYCSWAVSQGYTAHGDKDAWTVHGGKLYLNYNKSVRQRWSGDIPGNVSKGEANWPKVLGG